MISRYDNFGRRLAVSAGLGLVLALLAMHLWQMSLKAPDVRFEARDFQLIGGEGSLTQTGLEVRAPAENGQAMVMVPLPRVPASEIETLTFKARGLDQAFGSGLLWLTAEEPARARSVPLSLSIVQAGEISTANLEGWEGEVIGVGFVVQGPFTEPVVFQQLGTVPAQVGLGDTLVRMMGNLTHWTDWEGGSVNFYIGAERQERRLTPALMVGLWVLFSIAVYALGMRMVAGRAGGDPIDLQKLATASLVLFLLGWALLDIRWQIDLWQRHVSAWTDPTLADDAERKIALQALRTQVLDPVPDRRVFLISAQPTEYRTYRTRYHLGAAPVSFGMNRLPTVAERASGDILLVLGSTDRLIFERATGRLESSTESIPVTLLGNTPQTGGVFLIAEEN